jgi:hypothetical protein
MLLASFLSLAVEVLMFPNEQDLKRGFCVAL